MIGQDAGSNPALPTYVQAVRRCHQREGLAGYGGGTCVAVHNAFILAYSRGAVKRFVERDTCSRCPALRSDKLSSLKGTLRRRRMRPEFDTSRVRSG